MKKILQSKLLWTFALKMRRRWFEKKGIDSSDISQAYIRLMGKPIQLSHDTMYEPYLRLSYDTTNGWYYRNNGWCGDATYQEVIEVVKGFIKHDKLRSIKFM